MGGLGQLSEKNRRFGSKAFGVGGFHLRVFWASDTGEGQNGKAQFPFWGLLKKQFVGAGLLKRYILPI